MTRTLTASIFALAGMTPTDAAKDGRRRRAETRIVGENLTAPSETVGKPWPGRYACTQRPTRPYIFSKGGHPASPFAASENSESRRTSAKP